MAARSKTVYHVLDATMIPHTRVTHRVYTHAVAYLPSFSWDMGWAMGRFKEDGDNWAFSEQMVRWGGVYKGERKHYQTDEEVAKVLAYHREKASRFKTREAAIEGLRKARIADINNLKEAGHYAKWIIAGWCGSHDLAVKQMMRAYKKLHAEKVEILEAKVLR